MSPRRSVITPPLRLWKKSASGRCQCEGPGCPEHPRSTCDSKATVFLVSLDAAEPRRIATCTECAGYKLDSGLFDYDRPIAEG